MTFTVPIPSNSHEVIRIRIPTHPYDSTLFTFLFFPIPPFTIPISMPMMYYFETTKAEKCVLNYQDKYSTNITMLYH